MRSRGFTLIETIITVAIAAILLTMALTSFNTMMASARTRSVAESILAGLQMARSEAIARNAPMRFQLVYVDVPANPQDALNWASCSSDPASPAPSLWVVSQTDLTGTGTNGIVDAHCDAAAYMPTDTCIQGGSCTDSYWIAFKSAGKVVPDVTVEACTDHDTTPPDYCNSTPATVVTFDPLGKVVGNLIGQLDSLRFISVRQTTTGNGDPGKVWAVRINANGGIKFCDPALAASEPLSCS